jgi:hypothetical protein
MNYPQQIHYQTHTVYTPAGRPDEVVIRLIRPVGAEPQPMQIYTRLADRLRHEVAHQIRIYRPQWTNAEIFDNTRGISSLI